MKFYQKKYPISDTAEYVVDYVYENVGCGNFYFQLVRLSDNAILYANKDMNNIIVYCWKAGIAYNKVSFI